TLGGKPAVSWHSWITSNGGDQSTFNAVTNPWSSIATFTIGAHGDPDMTYGLFAKNNTSVTQTYSFTFGEQITPGFSGPYGLRADLGGSLTSSDGAVTLTPSGQALVQSLRLSTDGGASYFNAGVDVGPAGSGGVGTSVYGPYAATLSADTG